MAKHSTLTGADLHEPKGVSSALSGNVYIADGAGSGAWDNLPASDVSVADASSLFSGTDVESVLQEIYEAPVFLHGVLADVSTASFVMVPIPDDGEVSKITFTLGAAITAANATITVTRGGDSASLGTQVITQAGS